MDETNARAYLDMLGRMVGSFKADNDQRSANSFAEMALRLLEARAADQTPRALPVASTVIEADDEAEADDDAGNDRESQADDDDDDDTDNGE